MNGKPTAIILILSCMCAVGADKMLLWPSGAPGSEGKAGDDEHEPKNKAKA